jgi:Brp/Blh family beta-carotene 15,15'-monooxygenase
LISLPIKPFLIAWHLDAKVRFQYLAAPIFLFLFTLVLWAIHIITPSIFEPIQIGIFTAGLFLLGIPHGAVDHLLVKEKQKHNIRLAFVISYLSKAFAFLLLWLFVPNLALLFFLIYSAWHFGEADMHEWQFKKKRTLNNWIWGIFLLGILLLGHLPETNQILGNMKVNTIPLTNKISIAITMVLAIISILWAYWERRLAMFISATILLICVQLPLITSFGIYFIGQHSLNGWTHLKKGLHLNNKQIFAKALPFNLGAFILFGCLLYYFNSFTLQSSLDERMKTFFIFISCISFPHIIAMNKFYQLIGNQLFYDSKK